MDRASAEGHVDVLQWWLASNKKPLYTFNAVLGASRNGHLHVLNWWRHCGLKFDWRLDSVTAAAQNGFTKVLDWWLEHEEDALRSEWTMENFWNIQYGLVGACKNGNVCVLDWFKNNGFFDTIAKYRGEAMQTAFSLGHTEVLDWWISNLLNTEVIEITLDTVSKNGVISSLKWFDKLLVDPQDTSLLDAWLRVHKINFTWSTFALDMASKNGHIKILDWWKASGLEMVWSENVMSSADIDVLEWWKRSGLKIKWSSTTLLKAEKYNKKESWRF
ncbi:hypothetical protein HK096_010354 [Nowakowskiella sp. JEL0078]|nr:hypothetical protein HK096_010354 [Nowakowskiella sp. JEL0078]